MEIAPLLQEFDVDSRVGLNWHDAQRRLECFGYNEPESAQAASPLTLLLGQFRNVLIIVLLAAAGLSAMVGEVVDAMIILIIVFFSAVLGFFQEYRAERAVKALKRMLAPTARVLRDGEPVVVSAREAVHSRAAEVQFSSERKRMTTIHRGLNGTVAFMKGAPELVLDHCRRIPDGDGVRKLDIAERRRIQEENEAMAGDALRVLALAYRELDTWPLENNEASEMDMVFLDLVGMSLIEATKILLRRHRLSETAV